MEQIEKNKQFISEYLAALSEAESKTMPLLTRFITDQHLIEHILFFESVFPKYKLIADEITCEENRVIMYGRFKGTHLGELNGIPPSGKSVELPLAVGYKIENNKIAEHWLVIDQMTLMEQLKSSALNS
jgi:predicted ester cyclase